MKFTASVAIVLMAVLSVSCTSIQCGLSAPGGSPLIELSYTSEGDAPTITSVRVYQGFSRNPSRRGLLELEAVGSRRQCHKVRGETYAHVRELLRSRAFRQLLEEEQHREVIRPGSHDPWLGIRHSGVGFTTTPESLSDQAAAKLSVVEDLFLQEFPRLALQHLPYSLKR